jgi:ParB family transcriptional regulator, chromosome partitioning protein
MEFVSVPLAEITVGPRLREVDPNWVALIAASMAERGQDTPVQVRRTPQGYALVAGAHRMAALHEAGIPNALATVVDAADDDEARLIEIDENLMRRELSQLDRASFLAERQAIYQRLYPETANGKAPKGKNRKLAVLPLPRTFTVETADRLGLSRDTIERLVRRAKALKMVRAQLAGTRWADNGAALDALARIRDENDLQDAVAALTRAEAPCKSVPEALREVGLTGAPSKADGALSRLTNAWKDARGPVKSAFLAAILADDATRDLVTELLEAAEHAAADGQTRVLRAVGQRGAR